MQSFYTGLTAQRSRQARYRIDAETIADARTAVDGHGGPCFLVAVLGRARRSDGAAPPRSGEPAGQCSVRAVTVVVQDVLRLRLGPETAPRNLEDGVGDIVPLVFHIGQLYCSWSCVEVAGSVDGLR
jgi:hypothetical protein